MTQHRGPIEALRHDLQAPMAVRGFGSGWFAGFFALVLAIAGCAMVIALRWPGWFAMPELAMVREWRSFRIVVHGVLLASYALALLSLLLRPRKVLGFTALGIGIFAALLGGANVQPSEAKSWGIFFGLDFFVVNLAVTGLMFAPVERLWPRRPDQRLFRVEWREDLFYYLVSSMMVQAITFLSMAPSRAINAHSGGFDAVRAAIGGQPWLLQLIEIMLVTDFVQYWFHRAFHRVPFLWGFHAVHHSAKSMDWLAGSRMHFFEIVALRGITGLPLLTLGFAPSVMQAYVALVYVYASLVHANLGGDLPRLGRWLVTPRFHHWHHGLEAEAVDVNFAIHFPWLDRMFGTFHLPDRRWPEAYGVPEAVPQGYRRQFLYPFRRHRIVNQPPA
ncbi:sterol desaturase family protein [Sphingomonas jatrophae]|uniref:Sterol desaturase/sphingolipid hydroxylase, fatty acid hydroxylase superfamily n=1 Tax=Sphingomonas jatrophae TaxID=1166337 RepID=A0A1I6KZ10_9SPHN|nr:sterol desaturase family protein [Sphingomonas jatrophae]SFR96455.1 Sterol desaturase/sphingolipid hydroxylase, fatty acid hydroxylase superfamily [Sphingomonas jatrophae]